MRGKMFMGNGSSRPGTLVSKGRAEALPLEIIYIPACVHRLCPLTMLCSLLIDVRSDFLKARE